MPSFADTIIWWGKDESGAKPPSFCRLCDPFVYAPNSASYI